MSRPAEKILLFLSDFIAINATFWLWGKLRAQAGYFAEPLPQQFLLNAAAIFGFWFFLFIFYGLYRAWCAQSRVDEFINVAKTVSLGVFLIFLMTLDLDRDLREPFRLSRAMIVSYWFLMIFNVGAGRAALRTFQRTLLEAGYGARNTLIFGAGAKAREVFDEVRKHPALGYNLVGFVGAPELQSYKGAPRLGALHEIAEIIAREAVTEVIIAVEGEARAQVTEIMSRCAGLPVRLKIAPSLYEAVLGQVRTHQVYGLPLIEIMPESMPAWERRAKRLFDVGIALCAGVFLAPIAVLAACCVRFSLRGRILRSEPRVGKNGKIFALYRFAMDASEMRRAGFLGMMKIMGWDKIPRLFNVLKGDLSIIGPRPEAPAQAERRAQENSFYMRRFTVKPGLTGWAQIKCGEHGDRALQYDFYYIENMSLRMDFKILLIAMYNALLQRKSENSSPGYAPTICVKESA